MSLFRPVLNNPRRKKRPAGAARRASSACFWPVPVAASQCDELWRCYSARLDPQRREVIVDDAEQARDLAHMGYYGITNLQKEEDMQEWVTAEDIEPVPSLTTTANACPEAEGAPEPEGNICALYLEPVEAFFLSYGLGCLLVRLADEPEHWLNLDEMWQAYVRIDARFPYIYRVYHHFRTKSWVVKPGTKYGADFLLYKSGPPFFHAAYSVRVVREAEMSSLEWRDVSGLNRVTESVAKELILAQVRPSLRAQPDNDEGPTPVLKALEVSEVLVRRWQPAQKREEDVRQ